MKKNNKIKTEIMVIGLGYVGLPLALELAKYFKVNGFDINKKRIHELNNNIDSTNEITKVNKFTRRKIQFTCNYKDCKNSNTFIITVPTPVNKKRT